MKLWAMGMAVALLMVSGRAARADTVMDPKLAKMEAMVTNLGYTPTESSDKTYFEITFQGKYNYTMDFQMSNDGGTMTIYTAATKLDAGQLAKAPLQKLMEYNDEGDAFFSLHAYPDGEELYVNTILGADGLTPALLRQRLEDFSGDMDATDGLWDPSLWK